MPWNSPRDLALVQLVARFSQLAAPHIGEVTLSERSCTPLDRALAHLIRHNYLRRIGRRSTEDRPGSGGCVYELGKSAGPSLINQRFIAASTASAITR